MSRFHKSSARKSYKPLQLRIEHLEDRVTPSSTPLHVAGNLVDDPAGNAVALRGVNIISLEWRPDGDNVMQAVDMAIHDWHANLLRLPVNQDFWFGHNEAWGEGEAGDGGAAYRALVDQVISAANANNVYVVLDMHWSDMGVWGSNNGQHFMPDDHTTMFWQDAAARYANNPAVFFDPYNEPHFENDQPTDADFALWRDGGTINEDGTVYHSPGMQGLINTIRATGANNILTPEGLNWGSNLNGVLTGHALSDPAANIMYQSHLYPNKLEDPEVANAVENVAKSYPIYVGEWGSGGVKGQPSDQAAQSNQDMLAYLKSHPSFGWTAWAFNPDLDNEYNLISSWDANATTTDYGTYVKAALAEAPPPPPPAGGHHTGFSTDWNSTINGSGPQLLASGSFNSNADSIPDVAVTSSDGYLTIMLGRDHGFFDVGNKYFVGSPEGVVAGDFNRDGYQDLAVASNEGFVAVFLGDGNGNFNRIADLPPGPDAGAVPTYLTAADMDGDGNLDLIVADFSHPRISVFTGNGDGTFQLHDYNYAPNGVINAEQVVAADFDGDGILDIAVANKGDASVSLFKGLGNGYITSAGNIQLPSQGSIGIAAGDLDGDGKPDLAIANYGNDAQGGGAHRLNVLLNTSQNGNISFTDPISLDFGNHLLNVVIADFDEDGRNDLAVTSSGTTVDPNALKDDELFVLYNRGKSPGQADFLVPDMGLVTGWNPVGLIALDVNQDSHIDLVNASQDSNCVSSSLNQFEAAPPPAPVEPFSANLSVPENIEWADNAFATIHLKAASNGANVTGKVSIKVDGYLKTTVTVDSPDFTMQYLVDQLSATPTAHTVTVSYSGDANYDPITLTKTVNVLKRDTWVTLSAPETAVAGRWATFTATVGSMAVGMTGYVSFMEGNRVLGSSRVVNGQATFRTYSLAAGYHAITAVYKGDKNFSASDPADAQIVKITGNITGRFRITRSAITIDPATGLATQTITLRNVTRAAQPLPATLLFQNLAAGYTKIGVNGQTGTLGTNPLLDIANDAGELAPGESMTIQVSFLAATRNIRYSLGVLFQ